VLEPQKQMQKERVLMLTDRIDGLYLNTSLPPGIYSVCQRFIKQPRTA